MNKYHTIFQTPINDLIGNLPLKFKISTESIVFEIAKNKNDSTLVSDLVIYSKDDHRADYICQLISDCLCLISAEPVITDEVVIETFITHKDDVRLVSNLGDVKILLINLVEAVRIVEVVFDRKSLLYAIHKFSLSIEIVTLLNDDVNPIFYFPIVNPKDQTRLAYSLILCYSIIEELNLQIKASKEKPSTKNGKWNSEILNDLLGRLQEQKIPVDETITWYSRGPNRIYFDETKYEKLKEYNADFNEEDQVKDKEIKIEEAIRELSFLRSTVSSHKFSKKINDLTIYDVKNGQLFCKWLLLKLINSLKSA